MRMEMLRRATQCLSTYWASRDDGGTVAGPDRVVTRDRAMLVDDLQLRAPPIAMRTSNQPISAAFTVFAFRSSATGAGR